MSTSTDDVQVDLDAADAAKAAEAAKKPKNGADASAEPAVEVIKAEPEPARAVLTPDAGLEKLKKQLEDEKSARLAAEAREREAAHAELQARTEVRGSQLDQLTTGIAAAEQSKETLKAQLAEAMTAQDYTRAAEVQSLMSDNAANLLTMRDAKKRLESAPKPVARAPVDPVEQFAAQLTPQSAAWVREHPEYVRDARKNQKMLAAHAIAMADGIKADTPEYFQSIEQTLKIAPPVALDEDPTDDPMKAAAQMAPIQRRAAPAAAPVTRSGNGTGSRANVYRASAAEVEAAELSGLSVEEYVRNREALKKEGKLN
jgi:hypothetical protein